MIDPVGSKPIGNHVYLLRFAYQVDGVPVDHGSLFFRINSGNLIQVASQNIAPTTIDTEPSIDQATGWAVVQDYLGPLVSATDRITDRGSLHLVPVTPQGVNPDDFTGSIGSGFGYKLAWRFAFNRPDVIGSWEAVVDAHTGELLRFVDGNRYGRIHGGAYPGDNHVGEADRSFPFADTGLPAPNQYADAGGLFPGDNATTTLQGKYARINDSCGSISNTTTTGDVDFSLGRGRRLRCPDREHRRRRQHPCSAHPVLPSDRGQPSRSGLSDRISAGSRPATSPSTPTRVRGATPPVAATPSTSTAPRAGAGISVRSPGVSIHEWGHSLDSYDGSGGSSTPVETYADWMAALHLHDSCVGRGFYLRGNCGGYGDPCLDCSGIRDMDWTQHDENTPWTAANYGTVWSGCGGRQLFRSVQPRGPL